MRPEPRHPDDIVGVVVRWNPNTWWGTFETDELPPRKFEFHGTSVRGYRGQDISGARGLLILNSSGRLLSVELP